MLKPACHTILPCSMLQAERLIFSCDTCCLPWPGLGCLRATSVTCHPCCNPSATLPLAAACPDPCCDPSSAMCPDDSCCDCSELAGSREGGGSLRVKQAQPGSTTISCWSGTLRLSCSWLACASPGNATYRLSDGLACVTVNRTGTGVKHRKTSASQSCSLNRMG